MIFLPPMRIATREWVFAAPLILPLAPVPIRADACQPLITDSHRVIMI